MSDDVDVGPKLPSRRALILLLLWLGVAFMSARPGDGDHYLHGDALHYAAIAKSTLESGDLLSLQLAGEPYFKKPPLLFWMAMGSFTVVGYQTWGADLVGILCALGVIVFTFVLVERLADRRHAFLAAGVMTLTYAFLRNAGMLRFASPLTLSLMLSLWAVIAGERRRALLPLFWVGVMIGVGLKAAAGLFAIPVLILWSLLRRRAYPFNVPVFWLGLPLVPLLILPWLLHNHAVFGDVFWDVLAGEVSKVAGSDGSGVVFAKYAKDLVREYWPWLPFFLHGGWLAARAWLRGDRNDRIVLPLAWILGVSLVLLSLNRAYSRYVVPMLPASSLLVATSILTLWPRAVGPRMIRSLTIFLVVGTALLAFTPVRLHGDRMPDIVRFHRWLQTEGLQRSVHQLGDSVSWSQQSAAVFYLDMTLAALPPDDLLERLAEQQPLYAIVRRSKMAVPEGAIGRVVDSGRDYDLVELLLADG